MTTMNNNSFLKLALQYLVLSFESQVYYHLSDFTNINRLPQLMSFLGEAILDVQCDHDILLEYHPRLISAYQACLTALRCQEHVFSSDGNELLISPSHQCVNQLTTEIDLVVSLFWESPYDRGLAAAHKSFK